MRGELGGGTCLPKSGYVRFVAKSKSEEGSCALFAKAKVDARERLEFTEGSTPRERCRSVTTADTRECLEILVFLFLVTPSLVPPLRSSLPSSLSLITLLGPQGNLLSLPLLYIFFVDVPISVGKKEKSRRESDPGEFGEKQAFSNRLGTNAR